MCGKFGNWLEVGTLQHEKFGASRFVQFNKGTNIFINADDPDESAIITVQGLTSIKYKPGIKLPQTSKLLRHSRLNRAEASSIQIPDEKALTICVFSEDPEALSTKPFKPNPFFENIFYMTENGRLVTAVVCLYHLLCYSVPMQPISSN